MAEAQEGMIVPTELLVPPWYAIESAREASLKSPCASKRGVSIWAPTDSAISCSLISIGWNDRPGCTAEALCKADCAKWATHAEVRAVLAAKVYPQGGLELLHVKTIDEKIVPSGGPSCTLCSHVILSANIAGVWLFHTYGWHRYDAREFHKLSLEAC
jgi:hypothetical protein